MTDKLTAAVPRIAKLLRMVLSPDATDSEWQISYSKLMTMLKDVDPGGHAITERIEATSEEAIKEKIKDEAKKIFEAGRAKGRTEEIESRQHGAAAIAAIANINTSIGGVRGGGGVNGYTWKQIVSFCLANKHHIHSAWAEQFIESVAAQLASPYFSLTAKQQAKVAEIFQQYFNSRV